VLWLLNERFVLMLYKVDKCDHDVQCEWWYVIHEINHMIFNEFVFRIRNIFVLLNTFIESIVIIHLRHGLVSACRWWKILIAIYYRKCETKVKDNYHTNLADMFVTICDCPIVMFVRSHWQGCLSRLWRVQISTPMQFNTPFRSCFTKCKIFFNKNIDLDLSPVRSIFIWTSHLTCFKCKNISQSTQFEILISNTIVLFWWWKSKFMGKVLAIWHRI
jgi:hypothetical protein